MHTFTRILTRLAPTWTIPNPQELLFCGKTVFTNEDKVRTFHIEKVKYDDNLTPMYGTGERVGSDYVSLVKLYKDNPSSRDTIILDTDKNYEIYKPS